MSQATFDPIVYFDQLRKAGETEDLAKIHSSTVNQLASAQLATKADMLAVKAELKADVQDVRNELQAVKAALKADVQDVRNELQAVKVELKADVQDVRLEIEKVRGEIANSQSTMIKWMIGVDIAMLGALIAILKYLILPS